MPIYEFMPDTIRSLEPTTFGAAGVKERHDLQRLLRTQIQITVNGTVLKGLPKRQAIFTVVKYLCESEITPEQIIGHAPWRKNSMFWSVEGNVGSEEFLSKALSRSPSGRKFDPHRFFINDSELIHSDGRTYALSNQWGIRTYPLIKALIEAFPNRKVECTPSA